MEVKKSKNQPSTSWKTRKADGITQSEPEGLGIREPWLLSPESQGPKPGVPLSKGRR